MLHHCERNVLCFCIYTRICMCQLCCSSNGASALQGDERFAACLLYFPELTEFAPGGRAENLTLSLLSL